MGRVCMRQDPECSAPVCVDCVRFKAKGEERDAIVAFVKDRAGQYKASSGSYCALEELAALLSAGEHRTALAHGELDDLLQERDDG